MPKSLLFSKNIHLLGKEMSRWEAISIPEELFKKVEALVEKGYCLCTSEFVSEAIENLLQSILEKRKNRLYTQKHVWIEDNPEEAKVGLSEYVANALKCIIEIKTVESGQPINREEPLALVEATSKRLFVVYSPVTGFITSINKSLLEEPYLINEDPYGAGWIFTVKPTRFEIEKKDLLTWENYDKLIRLH
jgi:glycine cleavage system H protein